MSNYEKYKGEIIQKLHETVPTMLDEYEETKLPFVLYSEKYDITDTNIMIMYAYAINVKGQVLSLAIIVDFENDEVHIDDIEVVEKLTFDDIKDKIESEYLMQIKMHLAKMVSKIAELN